MAEGTWEGCADPYADAATDDAANYAATRLMFRDYQAAMRGCVTLSWKSHRPHILHIPHSLNPHGTAASRSRCTAAIAVSRHPVVPREKPAATGWWGIGIGPLGHRHKSAQMALISSRLSKPPQNLTMLLGSQTKVINGPSGATIDVI